MTAAALLAAIRAGDTTCTETTAAALERITTTASHGAWVAADGEAALTAARELDRTGPAGRPLFGLPIGVKDVIETADLPTAYGSSAYVGNRPRADAACVAILRAAGAIVVGKTTSTEFACLGPTAVANPRAPGRTPGGSSSGSAAAVAAGVVPVALGTQTAGSVVRPAAYCGIVGFKPTFGAVGLAGVLPVSASLDTLGLLAADVDTAVLVTRVLLGAEGPLPGARSTLPITIPSDLADGPLPNLGVARTTDWDTIEPATRDALEAALDRAAARGAHLTTIELPAVFPALIAAQRLVQLVETAHALVRDRDVLSAELGAVVAEGLEVPARDYWAARACVAAADGPCHAALAPFDAVLTPATTGAPPPLPSTGDPWFCRAWTALGVPAASVPAGTTPDGLPVGLQVVAPRGEDVAVLRAARWLTG
ncbi:Putative amidase AmiD [Paraconexibacter sp. AEG42_29]|uniref:Amidase AmiD n=1 Tax=Paraconexibacter sp. AEG42_29 TaxID=2997339 RepID=A0AAU7AXJ8_9ACTN